MADNKASVLGWVVSLVIHAALFCCIVACAHRDPPKPPQLFDVTLVELPADPPGGSPGDTPPSQPEAKTPESPPPPQPQPEVTQPDPPPVTEKLPDPPKLKDPLLLEHSHHPRKKTH